MKIVNLTKPERIKQGLYVITDQGVIMNKLWNRPVGYTLDKDGYYHASLVCEDGKSRKFGVSRLVAFNFCENDDVEHKTQVDHLDGNKKFNWAQNLEWVTPGENTRRAEQMGLRKVRGNGNGRNLYSEEFVESICQRYANGEQPLEVYHSFYEGPIRGEEEMRLYQFLWRLKRRSVWPGIVEKYDYSPLVDRSKTHKDFRPSEKTKYTEEDVHWICSRLEHVTWRDVVMEIMDGAAPNFKDYSYDRLCEIIRGIRTHQTWNGISRHYDFTKAPKELVSAEDYGKYFTMLTNDGMNEQQVVCRVAALFNKDRRHVHRMYKNWKVYADVTDTPKDVIISGCETQQ